MLLSGIINLMLQSFLPALLQIILDTLFGTGGSTT